MQLPWWLDGKEFACSAGDQVWSLGWEDPVEKEMATHSTIHARKSRGQRSLADYSTWGCKESILFFQSYI